MLRIRLFLGPILFLTLLAGCVQRRMTIVSDPPGANVFVNGRELGAAPVDVPGDLFLYYGFYNIELVKDGYEPLLVRQEVSAPWYEAFPLDFFSENLWPVHVKDKRVFAYQLMPPRIVSSEELLDHANAARARGQLIGPPADWPPTAWPTSPPTSSSVPVQLGQPSAENESP
jgi:hypothetical protein